MLVELPFASFFSCKLLSKHGTDVDIHHLESLDPEMYRYYDSFLSFFCVRPRLFTSNVCLFVLFLATDINTISVMLQFMKTVRKAMFVVFTY